MGQHTVSELVGPGKPAGRETSPTCFDEITRLFEERHRLVDAPLTKQSHGQIAGQLFVPGGLPQQSTHNLLSFGDTLRRGNHTGENDGLGQSG